MTAAQEHRWKPSLSLQLDMWTGDYPMTVDFMVERFNTGDDALFVLPAACGMLTLSISAAHR